MSTAIEPQLDGRRQRGDASRRTILGAASQVIVERGVGAVTHRSVAEAAGVPLARVSYHYPRIDDLLLAAAQQYLAVFDERLSASAEAARVGERSIVEACTEFLYDLVTDGAAEFLSTVEVRLALHKRGRAVDDTAVIAIIGSFGVDDERAASIVAAMFGFAVLAATAAVPVTRRQVGSYVESALGLAA